MLSGAKRMIGQGDRTFDADCNMPEISFWVIAEEMGGSNGNKQCPLLCVATRLC